MLSLERKIPPPVHALLCVLIAWGLDRIFPALRLELPAAWLHEAPAILLVILAVYLDLSALWAFRKQRTTINPLHPERTRSIVKTGIYRHTRNPMYLGLLVLQCAYVIHLANPLSLLAPALFIYCINRFQIQAEERLLEENFAADYVAYKQAVPRWL